jgi:uncharacterized membrane protein
MAIYPIFTRRIVLGTVLSLGIYSLSTTFLHQEPSNVTLLNKQDGNAESIVLGINDKDEAVGVVVNQSTEEQRGFVVRNRRFSLLPQPNGYPFGIAGAINNRGEISGTAGGEKTARGVRWGGNNTAQTLERNGQNAVTMGITEKGVTVGFAGFEIRQLNLFSGLAGIKEGKFDFSPRFSFDKGMSDSLNNNNDPAVAWPTGKQEGTGIGMFLPLAVSGNGTIAALGPKRKLLLWRDGKQKELPQVPGYDMTQPTSVNDNAQVVGFAYSKENDQVDPILWASGQVMKLPVPSGGKGIAYAINAKGDAAVGIATNQETPFAVLWRKDGSYVDLNTYLSKDSKAKLIAATCINNNGTVGGYALENGKITGFLLKIKR